MTEQLIVSEQIIQVNGIGIYTKETKRIGETLLLLHCSSWNSEQWNSCIENLSKDYHVIVPDLRGHGRSDCPEEGYRLNDFVVDLEELLCKFQVERVHIVGSSMGAEIALLFAATYPEKVLSITCEGGFQNFYGENGEIHLPASEIHEDCRLRVAKVQQRPVESYESVDEMISYYHQIIAENHHEHWKTQLEAIHINRFKKESDGRVTVAFKPQLLAQYCEDFYLTDFAEMYKRLVCPILFLPDTREASDASVQKSIEHFRMLVKGQKTMITCIDGAEHALTPVIRAQEYSCAIREFLEGLTESNSLR